MTSAVYRTVGGKRRSPRPRTTGKLTGSFDGMLARLGLASRTLKRARKRR